MTEHAFIVRTLLHSGGTPRVLTENAFATRKEAEAFCQLTLYAMQRNLGPDQQQVTVEIREG